jgi:hypothetical protein
VYALALLLRHRGPPVRTQLPPKRAPRSSDTQSMLIPFRKTAARQKVSRLIRQGVGLREQSWPAPAASDPQGAEHMADQILRWVQRVMGDMRRPYGVDHVALALACRDAHGRVLCSNSFGVSRPVDFYSPAGMQRIAAFLDDVRAATPDGNSSEIVAALLSLGDIAYAMGERATA